MMFGIDVAKNEHDCCILGSNAEILCPGFTIANNKTGYDELYQNIFAMTKQK